jgi:hypothetical protein
MKYVNEIKTRKRILFATIVVAAIAVSSAWFLLARRGIAVYVMNRGSKVVTDVRLEYVGGHTHIGTIGLNEEKVVVIRPSSESSLTIQYNDADGNPVKYDCDVYIESSYRGEIEIVLDDFGVTSASRITH